LNWYKDTLTVSTRGKSLYPFTEAVVDRIHQWGIREGPDDSTSHMRAMLTHTSLTIPIEDSTLALGTWQGIYLFEHRARAHRRSVLLRCLGIL